MPCEGHRETREGTPSHVIPLADTQPVLRKSNKMGEEEEKKVLGKGYGIQEKIRCSVQKGDRGEEQP